MNAYPSVSAAMSAVYVWLNRFPSRNTKSMPLIGSTTFGTGTTVGLFVRDLELREVHLRGIRHEEWGRASRRFSWGSDAGGGAMRSLGRAAPNAPLLGVASTVEDVRFPAAANEISKLEPILHKNRKRTHAYNQSYNTYPPSPARSHPQGSPSIRIPTANPASPRRRLLVPLLKAGKRL